MTELWKSEMPRFADLSSISPPTELEKNKKSFFDEFGWMLSGPGGLKKGLYPRIEKYLQRISKSQWCIFREKLAPTTVYRHKDLRWRQFRDILFEVYAHEWLLCKNVQNIKFIPRANKGRTPDLEGTIDGRRVLVEVKNINVSDADSASRNKDKSYTVKDLTPTKLCEKIKKVYSNGIEQLKAGKASEGDLMYFFLVYEFDSDSEPEFTLDNDFKTFLEDIVKKDYPIVYQRFNSIPSRAVLVLKSCLDPSI